VALGACNFEVPSSSYLRATKLLTVIVEVIEMGPLNPYRVGTPNPSPIAELMPDDRVVFEAVVADENGERLPASALETLWFQCGVSECGAASLSVKDPRFEVPCDEVGDHWDEELDGPAAPLSMDSVCRIGAGDGRFEFVVPELGQELIDRRIAHYYGVVAWGQRSAASCWAARIAGDQALDNCGFIQRTVRVGPSWWMLVYADSIGLVSPIPIPQIPAGVLIQSANRVPIVSLAVSVDGVEQGSWPEQTQFSARRRSQITVRAEYDEATQLFQSYFLGMATSPTSFVFFAAAEDLGQTAFTSNAIHALDPDEFGVRVMEFFVDEYAEPGSSRIVVVYFDNRYAEGVATLEFEVSA